MTANQIRVLVKRKKWDIVEAIEYQRERILMAKRGANFSRPIGLNYYNGELHIITGTVGNGVQAYGEVFRDCDTIELYNWLRDCMVEYWSEIEQELVGAW